MTLFAEEDPSTPTGSWLNAQSQTWIQNTLTFLYNDIYDDWGLTQYKWWNIGTGRNITAGYIDTRSAQNGWREFMQEKLGSMLYSDATIGPMHGNATAFGAWGPTAGTTVGANYIASWTSAAGRNWRMRKVALWSCFAAANGAITNLAFPTFFDAFGIRPKAVQDNSFIKKNAGLFFVGDIPQGWGSPPVSSAQAETAFDELWVTGPNAWPGGCDPTWAFAWALRQLLGQYPTLNKAGPVLAGYYWLPYSGLYDNELMGNDLSNVHN